MKKVIFFIFFMLLFVLIPSASIFNYAYESRFTVTQKPVVVEAVKEKTKVKKTSEQICWERAIRRLHANYGKIIDEASRVNGVDKEIITLVILAESTGNKNAMGQRKDGDCDKGLMQISPVIQAELGIEDVFDPVQNIMGGTKYLKNLCKRFNNDLDAVLVAYNKGPTKVSRMIAKNEFHPEKLNYLKKINKIKNFMA